MLISIRTFSTKNGNGASNPFRCNTLETCSVLWTCTALSKCFFYGSSQSTLGTKTMHADVLGFSCECNIIASVCIFCFTKLEPLGLPLVFVYMEPAFISTWPWNTAKCFLSSSDFLQKCQAFAVVTSKKWKNTTLLSVFLSVRIHCNTQLHKIYSSKTVCWLYSFMENGLWILRIFFFSCPTSWPDLLEICKW